MSSNINTGSMLRVGTVLHDTYRIEGYLASGGFGNTYVATNIHFQEKVAVKEFFMKSVSLRDDNKTTVTVTTPENQDVFDVQKKKFKKEAQRLHGLHSAHIVSVHDFFDENGTSYYVMDFIDGESLAERLERTKRPLSEEDTLSVLTQVLDALSTAYNNDPPILHLDIKPANIMLDKKGKVRLIDFGASKQLKAEGGATSLSAVAISKTYAPPEQMEGNMAKFGPWTDFYALGGTLYTLLTNGTPPTPSSLMDDNTALKSQALVFPAGISDATRSLIVWMMEANRSRRPQTVEQIEAYLKSVPHAGSETVLDPPPPPPHHGPDVPPPIPPSFQTNTSSYQANAPSMPPPIPNQSQGNSGQIPQSIEFKASLNEGLLSQGGKIIITPTQFIFHPFSFNIGDKKDRIFNIADITNYTREAIPTWLDIYFNNKCYLFIVFSRERIILELEKRRWALSQK